MHTMESEKKVGRPRKKIPIADVAMAEAVAEPPPPPKRKINIKKAATETPATDTPATDTPATDTPATDTPATDTPATDTPATDTPARKRKINIKKAATDTPLDATLVTPAVPSKRKINIKPAPLRGETVIAKVAPGFPLIVTETVTVKVTPLTLDGRSLYYNSAKGKVYDLKFKYIGRLKDGAIVPFPDSDVET